MQMNNVQLSLMWLAPEEVVVVTRICQQKSSE